MSKESEIYKLGKILKGVSVGEEKEMNQRLKEKDLSVAQGFILVCLSAEDTKELIGFFQRIGENLANNE